MPKFQQREIKNPHLRLPMKFGGINGGALMNEQDTGDDVVDCIKAIVAFQIGARRDMPDFGIPDLPFKQYSEEILDQVRMSIEQWETRAALEINGEFDLTDSMILNILIEAGVSDIG